MFTKQEAQKLLSYSMGSDLHEEWRKTRLIVDKNGNKSFDPRWKSTKDNRFASKYLRQLQDGQTNEKGNIRNVKGEIEVDIANMTFNELPKDWQAENLAAAKVAIKSVFNDVSSKKNISQNDIESYASTVHDEWLTRNAWAKGGDLDKPYSELPENEKSKDRQQIIHALNSVKDLKEGRTDIKDLERRFGKYLGDRGMER